MDDMSKGDKATVPKAEASIDASLRDQLAAIERVEAPDRLLELARELQSLLRTRY